MLGISFNAIQFDDATVNEFIFRVTGFLLIQVSEVCQLEPSAKTHNDDVA